MKNWQELKGKSGTALVIGNGPSLSDVPVKFLEKYPSFGSNRIYLLEGFRPTYFVAVNPLVIEQFNREINLLECPKFITAHYTRHLLTDAFPLYTSVIPSFSRDPEQWVYEGYTVTYVSLQLAFYMGYDTVLLVGVDHSYDFEGEPNDMQVSKGDDVNHFSPDYFGIGRRWHLPNLFAMERAYNMAKTVYEYQGKRIVNLTPGSMLDVFDKGDIAEW